MSQKGGSQILHVCYRGGTRRAPLFPLPQTKKKKRGDQRLTETKASSTLGESLGACNMCYQFVLKTESMMSVNYRNGLLATLVTLKLVNLAARQEEREAQQADNPKQIPREKQVYSGKAFKASGYVNSMLTLGNSMVLYCWSLRRKVRRKGTPPPGEPLG